MKHDTTRKLIRLFEIVVFVDGERDVPSATHPFREHDEVTRANLY